MQMFSVTPFLSLSCSKSINWAWYRLKKREREKNYDEINFFEALPKTFITRGIWVTPSSKCSLWVTLLSLLFGETYILKLKIQCIQWGWFCIIFLISGTVIIQNSITPPLNTFRYFWKPAHLSVDVSVLMGNTRK